MSNNVSVLSLRTRTLLFLIPLTVLSAAGVFLLWDSQERLNRASTQIQEVLLPAGRLIEQARTQIDLQIQELSILHREADPTPQDLARLRLSPGVKSLLSLQSSSLFPPTLAPLFKPWAEQAARYEAKVPAMKSFADALTPLRELRQNTVLLHRAIDRELSVQLLLVNQGGHEHLLWGSSGLVIALLFAVTLLILVRVWMAPLVRLRTWMEEHAQNPRTALPPRSELGGGILSAPSEVQSLVESLRGLLQKIRSQDEELELRKQRTAENERGIGTMFSALHHLLRHNEELLKELIKKERLASMSEMAAQLAHEIRNPLNSLNLKLELMRDELAPAQRAQLDRVLVEIDRLDALTESHLRTTRSLLRGDAALSPAPIAVKLSDIIEAVTDTLKPEFDKRGIFVQRSILDYALETEIPANILKAALMNLLKNAAEALEGAAVKVIRVDAQSTASGWRIAVADTGCGVPEEFLRAPVESFKTTKSEGSGLGLVTSRNMLAPYGVDVRLKSPCGSFATEASLETQARTERTLADAGGSL